MKIQIRVPKSLRLRQKLVDKYTYLYREYRRFYPGRKNYTYQQLRQNIAEVATIVSAEVDTNDFHLSTFIPWSDNNWKQFYYKHWYFAITIETLGEESVALVRDAHYEGDHHNDIILSKPYEKEDVI